MTVVESKISLTQENSINDQGKKDFYYLPKKNSKHKVAVHSKSFTNQLLTKLRHIRETIILTYEFCNTPTKKQSQRHVKT